ncbi:MAG: hypothetical protein Q7P63_06985 [Verrucomicrobiota bacterium JB022]|nr:hypothetical protein [Verrucomicrobiota bacterium JB022]
MKLRCLFVLLPLLTLSLVYAEPLASSGRSFTETKRFEAPDAKQGVASDGEAYFAIHNYKIVKYNRTGELLKTWECPEGDPMIHLNAGIVLDGKLYVAHSNYPQVPMTSSIEIFDPETLEHLGSHSFGIAYGSCTWVDRRDGLWYICFAHYGQKAAEPNRDPSWAQLVVFDAEWRRVGGYVFPPELVDACAPYSFSGGGFGPDGRLYVTGHDHQSLYVLEFPTGGSVLRWVDEIPIPMEGQAINWDPREPWLLHGILRETREVISGRIDAPTK